jgi:glyoxylase-like metal-dependent hydrolase (beta-lactamase superfamily II)
MVKRAFWTLVAGFWTMAGCSSPPTATSVLLDAQKAMGDVKSLQISGSGMNAFFGQALAAGEEWPRRDLNFTRAINYDQKSMRDDLNFAQPTFPSQQQTQLVNGDKAWNVGPAGPAPQNATAEERQLHIWLTPHGFVKGAMASGNAVLQAQPEGTPGHAITFTALGKYQIKGTLDAQNMVTKVETTIGNPVLGDTPLIATFADYKDFGGVKFPTKVTIVEGGFPIWEMAVSAVQPNATVDLPVPDAVKAAGVPPIRTESSKLADGVWFVSGGSHHSLVVEFKDYIAIVEGPLTEERSLAVLAEARKLVPNKPVKYVLSTHHHFDHSGGLRTYVAEGATVVTHQSNVPFFERTFVSPATISPDEQSKKAAKPTIQGVADKFALTDGKQTVEMYATGGDAHTKEYLLIYLPKPKILVEADAFSPGPPDAPVPATPPPNAVTLYDAIQNLKLNVATIAPIHGRGPVPVAELKKFIGKT